MTSVMPSTRDRLPFTALDFAHLAWLVGEETQKLGWVTPGFRASPFGSRRLLRSRGAVPVVAVVSRGRSVVDLVEDLVDGVIAVNFANAKGDGRKNASRALLFDRVISKYDSLHTFAAA